MTSANHPPAVKHAPEHRRSPCHVKHAPAAESHHRRPSASDSASVAPSAAATAHLTGTASTVAARFKTRLCTKYEDTGDCPYATHCVFAHGAA